MDSSSNTLASSRQLSPALPSSPHEPPQTPSPLCVPPLPLFFFAQGHLKILSHRILTLLILRPPVEPTYRQNERLLEAKLTLHECTLSPKMNENSSNCLHMNDSHAFLYL